MAKKTSENFAPYAGPTNVISVIRQFRQTGLSWPLTKDEIQRAGISESLATRTLRALEFLKLIDAKGNRTDTINLLGRATTEEYPGVMADILKDTYADVFAFLDPGTATDTQFFDAFRTKNPERQRARMVTLFKGLCEEAELIQTEKKETRQTPKPITKKTRQKDGQDVSTQKSYTSSRMLVSEGSEFWYRKLEPLFTKLPSPNNPTWSSLEREKWHQALTALLDLYISEEDSKGGD